MQLGLSVELCPTVINCSISNDTLMVQILPRLLSAGSLSVPVP